MTSYIIVTFAFCVLMIWVVRNIINFVRLFNRYIFDGADSRSPFILIQFIVNFLFHIELLIFVFTAQVSPMFIFITQTYIMLFCALLVQSRLYGYVTMNISKQLKSNLYIISVVIYWGILFLLTISFNYNALTIPFIENLWGPEHIQLFVNLFNTNYFGNFRWVFFASAFFPIVLLWFDYTEKRAKHIKLDLLFFFGLAVSLLQFLQINSPYIMAVLDILYLGFPLVFVEKETSSILKHSHGIDSRIKQIQSIITNIVHICPNCPNHGKDDICQMNKGQKLQIKMIAKMIHENDTDPNSSSNLRDVVMRKHILYKKEYQNVYDKIDDQIARIKS